MANVHPRLWIALIGCTSLSACECCRPFCDPWPEPEIPGIHELSIVPASFHAISGGVQPFEVVAKNADGIEFDPADYPSTYQISWTSVVPGPVVTGASPSFTVAFTEYHGNPTEMTAILPPGTSGPSSLTIAATVTKGSVARVASAAGDVRAPATPIPEPDTKADKIHGNPPFAPTTAEEWERSAVVLLNGCALEGGVRSDVRWLLYEVDGWKDLEKNLSGKDCPRPEEFEVFAATNQAFLHFPPASDLANVTAQVWTDGQDELDTDKLAWFPNARIDADVHYLTWTGIPDEFKKANEIFGTNRVGIGFEDHTLSALSVDPDACGEDGPVGKCDATYINTCLGLSTQESVLNVVYIDAISGGNYGIACPPEMTENGRFIFVKTSHPYVETLAHEFGHILGHTRAGVGFSQGHVVESSTPGFLRNNLMHDRMDADRTHLSVGQAFRMVFDVRSWFQQDPALPNRPTPRNCGCEPYVSETCPQLQRDPGEGTRTELTTTYCGSATGEYSGGG